MKTIKLACFSGILFCFMFLNAHCQTTDSTRSTFKIGKCRASVAGVRGGKISRKKLLKAKKVDVEWCEDSSKIISFDLSVTYSTVESYALISHAVTNIAKRATDEFLTNEMLSFIRKAPKGATVMITKIKYTSSGEQRVLQKDISLIIE